MTEWMPKPPVWTSKISARYYQLEPGDATRYEFLVYLHPTQQGFICIVGVEGAQFDRATCSIEELLAYLTMHPDWSDRTQCIREMGIGVHVDPFLVYLQTESGYFSHMTGLAAIMAMKAFLDDEALL